MELNELIAIHNISMANRMIEQLSYPGAHEDFEDEEEFDDSDEWEDEDWDDDFDDEDYDEEDEDWLDDDDWF